MADRLRPFLILIGYLAAIAAVMIFAQLGEPAPRKQVGAVRGEPKVTVRVAAEDTATIEETMTCEITVSVESTETTATMVDVSNTVSFVNGATAEIVGARPSFEATESVPGGVKVNWGELQLVGGERFTIELMLKPKSKGTIFNLASAGIRKGTQVSSNSPVTFVLPPSLAATGTPTSIPFKFPLNKSIPNNLFGKSATVTGTTLKDLTASKTATAVTARTRSTTKSTSARGSGATSASTTRTTTKAAPSTSATTRTTAPAPASTAGAPGGQRFKDVSSGDWFSRYLGELTAWNIINGYPDATFKPDGTVNRAEFTALVVRGAGITKRGTEPFLDVDTGDWFYPMVTAAYNQGLIEGVSGDRFAPAQKLTREQAAVVCARVAQLPAASDPVGMQRWLNGFSDRDSIGMWARPLVATAVKHDLIKGYPNNAFSPQGAITRAEASALIYRIFFEMSAQSAAPPDPVSSGGLSGTPDDR